MSRAAHLLRSGILSLPAILAVSLSAACQSEHRVGLDEFLHQQQAASLAPVDAPAEVSVPATKPLGPYRVGHGDVLGITFSGPQAGLMPVFQVRVDRNGDIDLPVVGALHVVDMELEDIDEVIRVAFVPKVYNEVVVNTQIITPEPTNVLVVGAVAFPGLAKMRRSERNMLHAIAGVGGLAPTASGRVTVRRIADPRAVATYDLTDPSQMSQALASAALENGDIVSVETAPQNAVFVGGLVNRAAPQLYPPGTRVSVLQAIAGANGLRTDVTPHEGTLVRRLPDGTDTHVKLDLNRIARGEQPNIDLLPGDILWVPPTLETKIQDWVNRNIFFRAGMSVNYNVSGVEFLNRREFQGRSGGRGAGNLQDSFDPFGFIGRNDALNDLQTRPTP